MKEVIALGFLAWKLGLLDFVEKGVFVVSDKVNGHPTTYDNLFQTYAKKHGLPDWKLLKRIAVIESNLGRAKSVAHGLKNPNDVEASKSSDGKSWGLMQVTLTTAVWLDSGATVAKLNNAEYSINLAARYLAYLRGYFPATDSRHTEWVVKSYNQGQGNTMKERAGTSQGFAHVYWQKYLNLTQEI